MYIENELNNLINLNTCISIGYEEKDMEGLDIPGVYCLYSDKHICIYSMSYFYEICDDYDISDNVKEKFILFSQDIPRSINNIIKKSLIDKSDLRLITAEDVFDGLEEKYPNYIKVFNWFKSKEKNQSEVKKRGE